jgi:hypothetical protein
MKMIVLVIGKPERDLSIMQSIKKAILQFAPDVEIQIWERFNDVFLWKPVALNIKTARGCAGLREKLAVREDYNFYSLSLG